MQLILIFVFLFYFPINILLRSMFKCGQKFLILLQESITMEFCFFYAGLEVQTRRKKVI